jgi:flagellar hook-length control protein FliK
VSGQASVPTAYGVRLAEAAEKVQNTIALSARDGVSLARIQLSPESLGAIQIHLQHTSEGLVARVVTEHPEAARALAQSGDDLRRSLSQSGTPLLRLDIESSDQRRSAAQQQASGSGASGRHSADDTDEDDTVDAATAVTAAATDSLTPSLSGSALVNVLA